MATILLAAAGGALGSSLGGGLLGVSSAVIGRAVGATVGALIDQRLFGAGSRVVEVGRRDQLRMTGSREGVPIPRVWGRMRLGGQIIWSSGFVEEVDRRTSGGKGSPGVRTDTYSYSVSLAIAVCEGEIARISRVWADGQVVDTSSIEMRVYPGDEFQLPDPLIAASLDTGEAPAFRGTAYVVIEGLDLTHYGNRIPQFSFEVVRRVASGTDDPIRDIRAVALVPGTGEYGLATERVSFEIESGETRVANVNNDHNRPDLDVALESLVTEVPQCGAVSLVVSWFGTDLRCDQCQVLPKVEQSDLDGAEMPWSVSGQARSGAEVVGYVDGRPGFGGTPSDAAVLQAIAALQASGQAVMFYPFMLMDIRPGNGLTDPWTGESGQPPVPWRGRITASVAPGRPGSPDQTAAAAAEVAAFFGTAQLSDFTIQNGSVIYSGPAEWSYRRFILHYAHLCSIAGGLDAFCVGSEMRGLTQLRDGPKSFPTVQALRTLAGEVRTILGPGVKISYAADWSEYFGYQPPDGSGDIFFHLDPFWADPAVDFIGIDNYMPLSDWRDGDGHADAEAGSIYDLDYLRGNIEGGEGYDWYYGSSEGRLSQIRLPIEDGAYGEPWIYRYKDVRNWWTRFHWNRIGGVKEATATDWIPESKPVWFTELGCPAVDKGTNQPNVFVDPQSSENALPHFSNGGQDQFIQQRYLLAVQSYWADPSCNPLSREYGGPMLDLTRAFVWAWDARPYPEFPQALDVWSDGRNHRLGHWISGRSHLVALKDLVREVAVRAGVHDVDVTGLDGTVAGYHVEAAETARETLQPLMLGYGFDAAEREGTIVFRTRTGRPVRDIDPELVAVPDANAPRYELTREPEAEMPARVRVSFVHLHQDYQTVAAEAQLPGAEALFTAGADLPIAMSHAEGTAIAARWLAETQVARDRVTLALPRSDLDLGPGDVVSLTLDDGGGLFRIDRVEETLTRRVEAVRVEPDVYRRDPLLPELVVGRSANRSGQAHVVLMDLPLMPTSTRTHAPWVAATLVPWTGPLAVYSAPQDHDYSAVGEIRVNAITGRTLTDLPAASPDRWAEQSFDLRVLGGEFLAREATEVLSGANALAIRAAGATDWEIIQFRDAELVAERTYRLSGLLRGQRGTDALIVPLLAAGAEVVALDAAALELPLSLDHLGRERHVRVGPAARAYSDPLYRHLTFVPRGVGLRPYAPAHLRAVRSSGGAIELSWIRRTRSGGDGWSAEVPLGEAAERYRVIVALGGSELRELEVGSTAFSYTSAMQAVDGVTGQATFRVAQISDVFGPGLEARIDFDG